MAPIVNALQYWCSRLGFLRIPWRPLLFKIVFPNISLAFAQKALKSWVHKMEIRHFNSRVCNSGQYKQCNYWWVMNKFGIAGQSNQRREWWDEKGQHSRASCIKNSTNAFYKAYDSSFQWENRRRRWGWGARWWATSSSGSPCTNYGSAIQRTWEKEFQVSICSLSLPLKNIVFARQDFTEMWDSITTLLSPYWILADRTSVPWLLFLFLAISFVWSRPRARCAQIILVHDDEPYDQVANIGFWSFDSRQRFLKMLEWQRTAAY